MPENRDDDSEKAATETGDDEKTPLQREIEAAIHRIFELLGQERPQVTIPRARPVEMPAGDLPEEVRRALADSLARMPPVGIPISAPQGGRVPRQPPRARKDPERHQREFLAALRQTIANLERIHAGLDPKGAEEVRKILQQLGRGGGPGEPVN